ncbi:MAG: sugar ABC transporter permease [Clostridia bacterium]|nr:sugar ABC transporter permease [Clostridia bacterium]
MNTKYKTRFNATSFDSEANVYQTSPQPKPIEEVEVVEEVVVEESVQQAAAPVIDTTPDYVAPVRKKRFRLSLKSKKALSGWLFCLPFVLGIIGIYIPIIYESIKVSFFGEQGTSEVFSFSNYIHVFTETGFSTTIVHAVRDLIIQIPAIVVFSLFMAIILNQKMAGRTFFRAIFFLPVILSTGIIDALDAQMTVADALENAGGGVDTNSGEAAGGLVSALDMQALLSNVNLEIKLGDTTFNLVDTVTLLINNIFNIVSRSGVQMLIFLSGLQSISPSIYESCQMEGATAWETFWKITLPMISPMILVNSIYTVVDLFTAADNRVMQGLLGYGGEFLKNRGYYSAAIWVYILLVLVVIVVITLLLRTVVFYQRRD